MDTHITLRRWHNKKVRWAGLAALLAVSTMVFGVALAPAAANADPLHRQSLPIVAGTEIQMDNGGDCTAGLVLRKNGFFRFLSPKERATRYIIIAKHCISNHDGEGILVGGALVGSVIQTDADYDLAMARVDPVAHQQNFCHNTSFGVQCYRTYTYTPRAVGRVILGNPRTRGDGSVPFAGTGDPGVNEHFCTSGAVTGVNCDFQNAPYPAGSSWFHEGVPQVARNGNFSVSGGDSGGPVVSPSGRFYGILTDGGSQSTEPALHGLIGYVDQAKVFRFASGYSIAPAS